MSIAASDGRILPSLLSLRVSSIPLAFSMSAVEISSSMLKY